MSNADEKRALIISKKDNLLGQITQKKDDLLALLPGGWDETRLIGLVKAAVMDTPKLLDCVPLTVYTAIQDCFRYGLEPNTAADEAWILPYSRGSEGGKKGPLMVNGVECTHDAVCIYGYKGYLRLAEEGGNVKCVMAEPVYRYEHEEGLFSIGTRDGIKFLEHATDLDPDPAKRCDEHIIGAYCRIVGLNGRIGQTWVSRADLNRLEPKRGGGWKSSGKFPTRYPKMCRKTAIRQLFQSREWPVTSALAMALENERRLEAEARAAQVVVVDEKATRQETLLARISATDADLPEEEPDEYQTATLEEALDAEAERDE